MHWRHEAEDFAASSLAFVTVMRFYGPMLLSLIGTAGLAAHRYLSRDESFALADRLSRLRKVASGAAQAQTPKDVSALDLELGAMFDELVEKLACGGLTESQISTALLVFKHVSDALSERRRALAEQVLLPATTRLPRSEAAARPQ